HGPLLTCSIYAFVGNSKMLLSFYSQFSQVLCQKQVDSPEIKHASVRRFATFDLFSRKRLATQDPSDTSDDQWVEYRSVFFREYSALLRDSLGPLRVNEVLTSFDNTGNVCKSTCFCPMPLPQPPILLGICSYLIHSLLSFSTSVTLKW
uniref:Si:ch73-54n14.2 n=1 Tax=Echeneis naucrates TaxID=173247 RepID=A0A665WZ10_ECHNA